MIRQAARALTGLLRAPGFDPRGKVVVITGGAGGIGSALGRRLARDGASIAVLDRDAERCRQVVADLPRVGTAHHEGFVGDLTDPAQVSELLDDVGGVYGYVDVLVNNTGMTSAERFADRSLESIDHELLVNLTSPLYVTRAAIPLLRRASDPRIISTVSLAGMMPQAETPIYCASKFGLRGAMLSIALDLEPHIRVSSVLPSATDTRMLRQEAVDGGNALQFQSPPQSAEDVVDAVVRLLHRPRLEGYPKPREARLVRAAMAFPNLLPVALSFFEGKGEAGRHRYLAELQRRGDVVEVDGRLVLR
ncbi:SDR family oxidoreductase [Kineococcus sp. NBC_00420]|uniref:SDR family NAD(P)-dependent oxidoreductase n=1 Tax=Kineococcus sp. NBC_00420 TaxID=2903564 RepID=UPI002E1D93C4